MYIGWLITDRILLHCIIYLTYVLAMCLCHTLFYYLPIFDYIIPGNARRLHCSYRADHAVSVCLCFY